MNARVGIVGGGALGLSLAYFLSRQGVRVTVFEARDHPGGLLDTFEIDGARIDKYYHCILGGDADLLALVDEIGLRDRVRFAPTRQGVYSGGRRYPMASGKDFLLFPPLSLIERFRLGLTVLGAYRVGDWHQLEDVPVEDWLVGLGGRGTFEKLWRPMLRAKFDGQFAETPATYIWSRLKRTSSPRAATGQADAMGYFVGSYKVFVDRLVERITASGSSVRTGVRVEGLHVEDGRVAGLVAGGERIPLDAVVATTPLPVVRRLLPEPYRAAVDWPEDVTFLGVVCGLLLLDRSLSPYYTLNIAEESIPLTGVIETTNLIAPEHVGGHHLVYLPRYVLPQNPFARLSDEALRDVYLTSLKRLFPAFQESWVRHLFVFRERFVEPLHRIGQRRPAVPTAGALPGLLVVNNGQIYPDLTNCQASVRHALRALPEVLQHVGRRSPAASGAGIAA